MLRNVNFTKKIVKSGYIITDIVGIPRTYLICLFQSIAQTC